MKENTLINRQEKSPFQRVSIRHYLILLGLICQGFIWELWYMPIVFIILWAGAVHFQRRERYLSEQAEALILFLCLLGGYWIRPGSGHVWFTALGNALAVTQLFRMTWPSNYREKVLSTAMAITHIAIGSQIIFDFRFLLLLLASAVLIPSTLVEMETGRFRRGALHVAETMNWRRILTVFVLMLLIFLLLPRWQFSPVPARFGLRHRMIRRELDSASGGDEGTDRLIFRIEGKDLRYLRYFALDTIRENTWRSGSSLYRALRRPVSDRLKGSLYRHVNVLSPAALGVTIPVDGEVVNMKGIQFQRPYVTEHGAVMLSFQPRRPFSYEYWTRPGPLKETLDSEKMQRYLMIPPLDPAVFQWLNQLIGQERDPIRQAQILVDHFHSAFTYRLGAPDLDRMSPLKDFLFEKREGHCERFASALAILLRGMGIPSRIVLGYVATERNRIGGFYNVRSRHGHAWTEAWFDGRGWITLDATPIGTGVDYEYRRRFSQTFYEWIDYVWYSKIIDYGSSEQIRLLSVFSAIMLVVAGFISGIWNYVLIVFGGILLFILLRSIAPLKRPGSSSCQKKGRSGLEASLFYGQMLHALARQHLVRAPCQTPLEFLRYIEQKGHESIPDIRFITSCFCKVYYGKGELTPATHAQLKRALRNIRGSD